MPRDEPGFDDVLALLGVFEQLYVAQCIVAIVRLGVPDRLGENGGTAEDVASDVGADADRLRRVLRFLAAHGIVFEEPRGHFSLTPRGRLLLRDHALSLWPAVWPRLAHDVAHLLEPSVRDGVPAFERHAGASFWESLAADPEQQAAFDLLMERQGMLLNIAVAPAVVWSDARVIVDVAGGTGSLLASLLEAAPTARGVLLERPVAAEAAQDALRASAVADRIDVVAGDMFEQVPPGDVFVLARVLHDWDDEDCAAILRSVRRAATPGAVLRVFEMVVPDDPNTPHPALVSDVSMLLLFAGGRERTAAEFEALFAATGWQLKQVVPSMVPTSVIEAVAV